jgi:DUF1365 family protein
MHTCLYEGTVWHRRQSPVTHRFRYDVSLMFLDLDEVDEAFRGKWLWTAKLPEQPGFAGRPPGEPGYL